MQKYLEQARYHRTEAEKVLVYTKHMAGHAGSFFVHTSLLLILAVGALILRGGKGEVYPVRPDEPTVLEDGTRIELIDFTMKDARGSLFYQSTLQITDVYGKSRQGQVSVNHPLSFSGKKYYQETFDYTPQVTILNRSTQIADTIHLFSGDFLQVNAGGSGITYMAAYTDYQETDDGQISVSSGEVDPSLPAAYLVSVTGTDGETRSGVVCEGTVIPVGEYDFTFGSLTTYPGIRIKQTDPWLMGCLYAGFGLMILGLWLCFFFRPVYVAVSKGADCFYRICGTMNSEGLERELGRVLNKAQEKEPDKRGKTRT
ncbi:MAG: cytochrome c biogenesis protein ResB [Clostridiales bacterium]|nr:cytochrome c biogenesis protein ResB [Clostridiales bacterium]